MAPNRTLNIVFHGHSVPSGYALTPKVNTLRHAWIMYRLSEFYLNSVECVADYFDNPAKSDTDFPVSAVVKLNELKTFRSMPVVSTMVDLDEFMEYYRNERMVELIFEGHRFGDVRRWKLGELMKSVELMKLTKRDGKMNYERVLRKRGWDDKMYLFPIADEELRKNTKLTQNFGWK